MAFLVLVFWKEKSIDNINENIGAVQIDPTSWNPVEGGSYGEIVFGRILEDLRSELKPRALLIFTTWISAYSLECEGLAE